jgi:hypothetical protein
MQFELPKCFSSLFNEQSCQKPSTEKETFHVGSPQQTASLSGKIIYGISAVASLGLFPVALRKIAERILPALTFSKEDKLIGQARKESFLKLMSETALEFDLQMDDGAVVNGMGIFQDKEEKKEFREGKAQNQRWLIYFNGNMQNYESGLYDFQSTGKNFNVNMLVFNYRGVGNSIGYPTTAADLIADGQACVSYLLSKGVPEENILVDGFSLGGGIGTQVASLYEKIGLKNFNSFGSLAKLAAVYVNRPIVEKIIPAIGWELDSVKAFEKIQTSTLFVFNKQDGVIPYDHCAYKMVKERIKQQNPEAVFLGMHKGKLKYRLKEEFKPARVKLQRKFLYPTIEAHVYDLKSDPAYPEIRNFVKTFFEKNN